MDTWERTSIYDEATLTPNSGAELCARSSIQNSELTEAEAPPLVFRNPESESEKKSELAEKNVDHLQHSVAPTTPVAEVSTPPATSSKAVSSIGSRMVVIFGCWSFATGVGLGAFLFTKPSWNVLALRSADRSSATPLANSVQTTLVAASAPDGSLSEANQLQSIGSELTSLRQDVRELSSLRQDIKSLADELAQIREGQSISKVKRRK